MDVFAVKNLYKNYATNRGVSNISFSIQENEIFGMIGPNGAGKTTTLECALGLRKKDSGSISILGYDPSVERDKIYALVGVQLQETSYPGSARVNELCTLMSSLYESPLSYKALLDEFELDNKGSEYIADLSGGQRQRLAIILALIPDPKIVVFDELTTGLDPHARRSMWSHIRRLKERGITVILTTHFMDEAQELCDRVAIMLNGSIQNIDTVENIISACSLESTLEIQADPKSLLLIRGFLGNSEISIIENQLSIPYKKTESLLEIIRLIDSRHIKIKTLSVRSPTLEDAYLKLTGGAKVVRAT